MTILSPLSALRLAVVAVLSLTVWAAAVAPAIAQTKSKRPDAPSSPQAKSMKIQQVKSPGGISAWLVESHNVPLLALRFAFDGGSTQDPKDKPGIANFLTALMDEGAGELKAAEFQERMEEIAMRMSFADGRDTLYGSLETLTANRAKAVELLKLAVTRPRFDTDAVERIRRQLAASIEFAAKDPSQVASKAWNRLAFGEHPYGRPAEGTLESIAKISSADIKAYHARVFARDTLKVVAVGDIDAKTLGLLLDEVFGALPAKAQLAQVAMVEPRSTGALEVIDMPVPQSVARFGSAGLMRKDPDFIPAYVVNQILGGGGFASRLMEEVREKRGLAYSVYSYIEPMERSSVFSGGVATKNSELVKSLDVIKAELARMAADGPTQTELDNAKSYLIGSFALRFDTNSKIASQLLSFLVLDLGIDYVDTRNAQIEKVTIADAKRAAARILKTSNLIVTVVGKPAGMAANAAAQ